jgi:hypothetical protein
VLPGALYFDLGGSALGVSLFDDEEELEELGALYFGLDGAVSDLGGDEDGALYFGLEGVLGAADEPEEGLEPDVLLGGREGLELGGRDELDGGRDEELGGREEELPLREELLELDDRELLPLF